MVLSWRNQQSGVLSTCTRLSAFGCVLDPTFSAALCIVWFSECHLESAAPDLDVSLAADTNSQVVGILYPCDKLHVTCRCCDCSEITVKA